jgi:uncharacterized protein YdaT
MAWSVRHYPLAMKPLEPGLRRKAIRFANAFLRQGFDEGQAIRAGIQRARDIEIALTTS